jgi:anaerobic ribonucleoside-triphosphate reductase activating protein
MTLLLNKAHFPVEVLGHGRRVGLWLQGCTIRCFGCISRDTWVADPNTAIEVDEVVAWIAGLPAGEVDGITISGGEPFDQPEALGDLLAAIDAWRGSQPQPVDVLCFSGRHFAELKSDFAPLLARLDAVVPEPFVQGAPTTLPLRGSANQSVIPLSPLGMARYSGAALDALGAQRERIQVDVDADAIWFIGIPEQGAMTQVRQQASDAGIKIRRPSWLL